MRYVDFPAGGPQVSVLGFGCCALMGRTGKKASQQALGAALDQGITFFDTARSYGYGESESLMGQLFAGRRQNVILCTKFGILPGPKGGWKQRLKPLAQAAIRAVPALRQVARKAASGQLVPQNFSVANLHASLETSLRELRTDYVDILLLHAAPRQVLDHEDLLEALARLVEQGKIRMAGISGTQDVIAEIFLRQPPVFTSAQFVMDPSSLAFADLTRQQTGMFLVAKHPFGGPEGVSATTAKIAALRQRKDLPVTLRGKLAIGDRQLMPEIVLNAILTGTGISAIVPAMMRPANLQSNVRAIQSCRFTPEELTQLRQELSGTW